ncbi:MAG: hypothetical protein WC343_15620 [Bacilli bacterium]|jgi:hypothetical protein
MSWRSKTNASLTVAASNSSSKDKAVADYICDGSADQVEINTAIASLTSGGRAHLLRGTFACNGTIVGAAKVDIDGAGNATVLDFGANAMTAYAAIQMADNSKLSNLKMIGDNSPTHNNWQSIVPGNYCDIENVTMENTGYGIYVIAKKHVYIRGVRLTGIHATSGWATAIEIVGLAEDIRVSDFYIYDCDRAIEIEDGPQYVSCSHGYIGDATSDRILDAHTHAGSPHTAYILFEDIFITGSTRGIQVAGANDTDTVDHVTCRNIIEDANTGADILSYCTDAKIVNCTITGTTSGSDSLNVIGCPSALIRDCSFSMRVSLTTSSNVTIENCRFDVSKATYSLNIAATCPGCQVRGGHFYGTTGTNDALFVHGSGVLIDGVKFSCAARPIRFASEAVGGRVVNCDTSESTYANDQKITDANKLNRSSRIVCEHLNTIAAASATTIRSGQDLSAAIPIAFTIDAQPDIPRTLSWSLTHSNITEYDITVVGINSVGETITVTWDETAGWSGETLQAFLKITSITMTSRTGTGSGDAMNVGITDVLGLSNRFYYDADILRTNKNGAVVTVATNMIDPIYNTLDLASAGLSAGDEYTVWYLSSYNTIM